MEQNDEFLLLKQWAVIVDIWQHSLHWLLALIMLTFLKSVLLLMVD